MNVFNPPHFLRHIGMPTLREFTEVHLLGPHLSLDWTQEDAGLPAMLSQAVEALASELPTRAITDAARKDIADALGFWYDDLRRCHLMANPLAVQEFLLTCREDGDALAAFADRDDREKAMWMFAFRDEAFRQAELHLSFLAKTNGRYWKKHRIDAALAPSSDRTQLEAFSQAVADLYQTAGAGKATHIEVSQREGSIQITLYVEGPVTALTHFSHNHFRRITTRIALETALLYQPDTGCVETIVKGGAKNHKAVLQLFGEHLVNRQLNPEEIEPKRYRLNALRDGLDPFEDWAPYGIRKVRLRRATLTPRGRSGESIQIEASDAEHQPDALTIARQRLKVSHAFETKYSLDAATLIVYPSAPMRRGHFSFNVFASGSSTIKNLAARHQPMAQAVLSALNVVDPDEPVRPEPAEAAVRV
ncbi:hypothetical protein U5801_26530 [Lamprobacter modestohalophilus]|uniref:hypothetical protein n=1 Tax=Lamprobacter modestohalophilus TaxID=1064514 RepID=UPI002ADEB0B4|nr:hypothetical protein [Lamprobacter modestohalophilus]MEA1053332.1 hypothetical protein [Lamprobacter modestohalophilus]